jgi:hypothetical protein
VQNANDAGICRQNSSRDHRQHCGEEDKSTQQTTQVQLTFPSMNYRSRNSGSVAGSAPAARFLNLPALTLSAVGK